MMQLELFKSDAEVSHDIRLEIAQSKMRELSNRLEDLDPRCSIDMSKQDQLEKQYVDAALEVDSLS